MIEKFWEKIGENLAVEWDIRRLGPSITFWIGGVILFGIHGNFAAVDKLFQLTVVQAGAVIMAVLAVVVLSNLLVSALITPLLRLLEGYWTPWPFNTSSWLGKIWLFRYLQIALSRLAQNDWNRRFQGEYQKLAGNYSKLNSVQAERYAYLDAELLTAYPKAHQLFLPTQIGNLIRAAEEYPQYWYGLQTAVTWPRLWLVLPETVQKEITEARQAIDKSIIWLLWAILFAAWVIITGWAIVISILAATLFLRRTYASAQIYGELIRAAYDLHRFDLYKGLSWSLPETPEEERKMGEKLTQFLRRRQTPEGFEYQIQKEEK